MTSPFRPAGALALIGMVLAAACTRGGDTTAAANSRAAADSASMRGFVLSDSQRSRITVAEVKEAPFLPILEVTGNVAFNGDSSTQVLSQISGPVSRILVQPGAMVGAGDVLATVSSPDFASAVADYRKAEAEWLNAKRIADRDEELFRNDALARSDLDQARTDLAAATADLDAAVQQMGALGVDSATIAAIRDGRQAAPVQGVIRAPIAGTVVERLVTPGQVLEAGATPTFTIADLKTMWVFANVYGADLATVHEGETAEIFSDAVPTPVTGRIDYIAALVDPATKATSVRIIANNTGRVLRRDMLVRVVIHADRRRNGILLAASAIIRDDENLPFVFIAKADGSFARRRVELGSHIGNTYEIRSGLASGEKVVQDGALFIQFAESQ